MRAVLVLSLIAISSLACKTRETMSETAGLAATADAKNVALLMSGLNKDEFEEETSREAVGQLKDSLEQLAVGGRFEVRELHNLTKAEVLAKTTEAAKDVGDGGTLFWYIGTHGWSDGFSTKDGRVRPEDLADALRAARRPGAPLKRLVMLFDYCGSGGLAAKMQLTKSGPTTARKDRHAVDLAKVAAAPANEKDYRSYFTTLAALTAGKSGGLGLKDEEAKDGPVYAQAVFFASAAANQTTTGDTFTSSIAGVVEEAAKAAPGMTIGEFLEKSVQAIAQYETDTYANDDDEKPDSKPQHALFRALPDATVLSDKLFVPTGAVSAP